MDLVLSDDQQGLQQELRRFLASGAVRLDADRLDRDLWRQLGDMGVFALTLPEADGGLGLGLADAVVVFEELGRAAVPGPLVSTALAVGRVDGAESGTVVVGLVPAGEPALVEHRDDLDVLLVERDDSIERLAEVPPGRAVARPTDPLTPVSVVDALPAGDAIAEAGPWRPRGGLLVAAFQVGLGQAAIDMGVGYAQEREQFGRRIGSFQAVKHLLVDATVGVETARAAVHAAAVTTDEGSDATRLLPGARVVASEAADRAARACIQVHGGMGYTWELEAHLLLKRVIALDTTLGGVEAAYDDVAAALS